jgi:hypothetical protein
MAAGFAGERAGGEDMLEMDFTKAIGATGHVAAMEWNLANGREVADYCAGASPDARGNVEVPVHVGMWDGLKPDVHGDNSRLKGSRRAPDLCHDPTMA